MDNVKSAKLKEFDFNQIKSDPIKQFEEWYEDALKFEEITYPHAFTLSTISPRGYPEGRVVLMKEYSDKGFVFYTNTYSTKGKSLFLQPRAGASFYWDPLGRQVRIIGDVVKVSDQEADEYYASRSRESQIGAWASEQSQEISSRAELLSRIDDLKERFEGMKIPRPEYWSGYRIVPIKFEFWTFGNNRVHSRFCYEMSDKYSRRKWRRYLLQP